MHAACAGTVLLHVRYVTDGQGGPSPLDLLHTALSDPWGIAVTLSVLAGLALFVWATTRWPVWHRFRSALDDALRTDHAHVPWVLRLSVGIPLMAAGLQGHWFLPHLDLLPRGPVAVVFMATGFLVLVGLAVRLAAAIALVAWLAGFAIHGLDLLMGAEMAAALAVLLAGAAGRPSLDGYLARALPAAPWRLSRLADLRLVMGPSNHPIPAWGPRLLQVGLGTSFAAAGLLEKILEPGPALDTAARYGLDVGPISPAAVVLSAGVLEMALGLLLIAGIAPRPLAALAFMVLTVTLFALPDDPVLGHVALWGVASAVFLLGGRKRALTDPSAPKP